MSPTHDSFTLTRTIAATPDSVFRAWAEPELKRRWFVDNDGPGWHERDYALDFRIGRQEHGRFELSDGLGAGLHENATTYLDSAPGVRIVFTYTMALNGSIHSASLATVTLEPVEAGCRLTYTEQGVFYGGSEGAEMRRGGWEHLPTALDATVSAKE